jgi:hypothetical protein
MAAVGPSPSQWEGLHGLLPLRNASERRKDLPALGLVLRLGDEALGPQCRELAKPRLRARRFLVDVDRLAGEAAPAGEIRDIGNKAACDTDQPEHRDDLSSKVSVASAEELREEEDQPDSQKTIRTIRMNADVSRLGLMDTLFITRQGHHRTW